MNALPIEREQIAQLIPHAGSMVLLDRILEWDAGQLLAETQSHLRSDNPLRENGQLHAVHLIEYGAQAMAVHGGLLARAAGDPVAPGLLVGLRDIEWQVDRLDTLSGALSLCAKRVFGDGGGWMYTFEAYADGQCLACGRISVMSGQTGGTASPA